MQSNVYAGRLACSCTSNCPYIAKESQVTPPPERLKQWSSSVLHNYVSTTDHNKNQRDCRRSTHFRFNMPPVQGSDSMYKRLFISLQEREATSTRAVSLIAAALNYTSIYSQEKQDPPSARKVQAMLFICTQQLRQHY